jgi:hypothetical protein
VYVSYTLGLFPWTRFIAVRLNSWVLTPLQTMGRAFVAEIPDLIFLVILAVVVRYGLKLLRLFFDGIGRGSIVFEGFDAEWATPTYKILRMAVIAFAVVVANLTSPARAPRRSRGCPSSPESSSRSARRRPSPTSSRATR